MTEDGEEYRAPLVISTLDAKTLIDHAGRASRCCPRMSARPRGLPDLLDRVQDQRRLPPAAAIHGLRPGRRPGFDYPTYVHIAPDIDYLERAYDDAKYGSWSHRGPS